jgi:hypothetical protein
MGTQPRVGLGRGVPGLTSGVPYSPLGSAGPYCPRCGLTAGAMTPGHGDSFYGSSQWVWAGLGSLLCT